MVDLRPYLQAMGQRWRLIVGCTIGAMVVAFTLLSLKPTSYTASADITLLNIRSIVVFDPSFTTIPNAPSPYTDEDERGDALRALAESPSLLSEVQTELESRMDSPPPTLGSALDSSSQGDLLRLKATWTDPESAALIANVWAERYIEVVNRSFVSTSSPAPEQAQAAASDAFDKYQTVQAELERYLAETNLPQLKREAEEARVLLEGLQEQRVIALTLVNTAALSLTSELADATTASLVNQVAYSVRRASTDQIRQLDYWYERRANLTRTLETLKSLESQLTTGQISGGTISGDFLALLLNQAGLLETNQEQPTSQVQIDLSTLSALGQDATLESIQALNEVVSEGITEANGEIQRLSDDVFLGLGTETPATIPEDHALLQLIESQTAAILDADLSVALDSELLQNSQLSQNIMSISKHLQQLLSEIEHLEAREKELLRARTAAWELYETLDNKAREVEAQFATGAPQVRLAIAAAVPTHPNPRSRASYSLLAGLVGAVAAALLTLAHQGWRSIVTPEPLLSPRPAVQKPLWSAFEQLPQGVILLDGDKSIRYLNKAASHLLNSGEGTFKGRPIRALRQPELADVVAALTPDGATIYREALVGQDRRLLIGALPLPHQAGEEATGFIVVLQDISELRGQRVELGSLLADLVAHVPLGQDSMTTNGAATSSLPSTNTESHQVIHLRDEIESVTERLTLLERAEAGLGERQPVFLKRLTQSVIAELLPMAAQKQIDIKEELPANLPPLLANQEQLHEVLKQLLDNAVKYSPSHTKVRLRAKVEEDSLTLAVLDSGIGIWVKDIPFLFDRYYRVQTPEVQVVPGHGLGLATVKAIVEAHGGRAWAESRPGTGSIFFVKLPLITEVQHRTPATLGNGNGSNH